VIAGVITLKESLVLTNLTFKFVASYFLIALISNSFAFADRPDESPAALRAMSSHVCAGIVKALNAKTDRSANWETTSYNVEIAVTSVLKGTDIGQNDHIEVRSDLKKWVGDPDSMPTGWNGVGAPPENAQVLVYLSGSKSKGFRFAEPNGFVDIETLRKFPDQIQSHMSNDEWDIVEHYIRAHARSRSAYNPYTLVVILVIIFILFVFLRTTVKARGAAKSETA